MRCLLRVLAAVWVIAIFGCSIASAGQAHAQARSSVRAEAEHTEDAPADPEKLALLRRYLAAIRIELLMRRTLENAAESILDDTRATTDERFVVQRSLDGTAEAMIPGMLEGYARLYAKAFTTDELRGLVEFYESPLGQSLMQKTQALSRAATDLMMSYLPVFEEEFSSRLHSPVDLGQDDRTLAPSPPPIPVSLE